MFSKIIAFFCKKDTDINNQTIINKLYVYEKRIERIKEIMDKQCVDGVWDSNDYTHGMANGLKLCFSIMENDGADFKMLKKQEK